MPCSVAPAVVFAHHPPPRVEGTANPMPAASALAGTFLLMKQGKKLLSASVQTVVSFPPVPYLRSPSCALPRAPWPVHPSGQAWHGLAVLHLSAWELGFGSGHGSGFCGGYPGK